MVLRSRCRSAGVASSSADVGSHNVALQTSVLGTVLATCSSNPYVSAFAAPTALLLLRVFGTYITAALAIVAAAIIVAFAAPHNSAAMAAGVVAGAVITPQLAACVVVWIVFAAVGTMALTTVGLNVSYALIISVLGALAPAYPFYHWQEPIVEQPRVSDMQECVVMQFKPTSKLTPTVDTPLFL